MRKLLSLALLIGLTLGAEAQSLISIIPLDTTSKFTINFVANGRAKYDVANYKILYQTPDVDGNPSTASGLMSVPMTFSPSFFASVYA